MSINDYRSGADTRPHRAKGVGKPHGARTEKQRRQHDLFQCLGKVTGLMGFINSAFDHYERVAPAEMSRTGSRRADVRVNLQNVLTLMEMNLRDEMKRIGDPNETK